MKSKVLPILTVVIGVATVAMAQQKPAAAPPPTAAPAAPAPKTNNSRLEVPEVTFRFGYAPQNAKIAHVYWLKNAGTDTMHLADVRPGCGCTKAPLRKKNVAPGDSADVEVIFSTGRYNSNVQKSATIISDAPGMAPALTFTAWPVTSSDSLTPFTVSPGLVDLDSLRSAGKTGDLDVKVKNVSSQSLQFSLVSQPDQWIKVKVPSAPVAPGKEEMIKLSFDAAVADTILNKSFTIEASDSAKTRFTVPIQKATRTGPAPTTTSATH
jgi:hypothetical protein